MRFQYRENTQQSLQTQPTKLYNPQIRQKSTDVMNTSECIHHYLQSAIGFISAFSI